METTQPKISSIALRYGLIAGLLVIIYALILQFTDLYMSKTLSYVNYLFVLGAIIMAYRDFKSQNQGFMTYGQGLGLGTLTAGITGVLSGIFSYIYIKFIDDTMLGKIADMQREELDKNASMTEEEIEKAIEMSASFTTPEMIMVFSIIGFVFFGFLMSLVVAAAMRNARPEFE